MSNANTSIKALLSLVLDAVNVAVAAESDGKITIADAALLSRLLPDLAPAFAAVGDVSKELAALQPEDAADLVTFAMGKLAIDNAKAQAVIAASLKFAVSGYELFAAIKA